VNAELAQLGGLVGAAGLAFLLLAPAGRSRLVGLAAWAAGGIALAASVAPGGRPVLYAGAAVAAVVGAVAVGALFVRWPWFVPILTLACVPARVPVALEGEDANLLLPLYAVVAGAAVALAWEILRGDDRERELGHLAWPLAAFVLWSGVSLLWTGGIRDGAVDLAAFFLPFGLLSISIARLPWSRRWLTFLFAELVAMAVVFAVIGAYQWVTRDVFWNPKVVVGNAYAPFYRVNSIFWDPSIYGRFLVLAIIACLGIVLTRPPVRESLAAAAAIAVVWVGLLLSFSQSSFAALLAAVLGAATFAWGRRALVPLAAAAVLLVLVGFSAPSVRDELRKDLNRATSGRSNLVGNGVRIAAAHPLDGVGLGGFRRAYAQRTGLRGAEPRKAASHSTPVTVAAEGGLPGFLLYAWLLVAALVVPLRRASGSFAGRVSLIVGLALMAIAVHSLFYDAFFEDPTTWGLFGLASVVGAWRGAGR
jgi:hypothetical protein